MSSPSPGQSSCTVAGWLLVAVILFTLGAVFAGGVVGTPAGGEAVADDGEQQEGSFGFESDTYEVDPPDTATVGLAVPDGGVFRVLLESPGGHFSVEVTAGYSAAESGGENPTVRLDTGAVGSGGPSEYLSVTNARVHRITVHENNLGDGGLPGGQYELRAIHGSERSVATLAVSPSVSLQFERELNQSDVARDPVRTITGETGIAPGEPLVVRVTSTGRDAFSIATATVVEEDGTFETTVDLRPIPAGASFEVTVHHDNLTRARRTVRLLGDLPGPVDGRQASDGITFAYEGDQLTLAAAPNQSITGETDLQAGAVVTLVVRSPESHLYETTTRIDSHGTFAVRANLDGLQPGTDVVVSAVSDGDASGAAPAVIVSPDGTDGVDPGGTTGNVILAEPGSADAGRDGEPHLASGLLAITLGIVLSVVGSGLLLGVNRSALP